MRASAILCATFLGVANAVLDGDRFDALKLLRRVTQEEVCQPPVEGDGVIPPCTSVETIETLCQPNGTEPIFLEAHAQCMCGGSFFEDWVGCRDCLTAHGFLPERDNIKFKSALAEASLAMCGDAVPTASFQPLFESAAAAQPEPTEGSTVTPASDPLSGSTAVSLYYTAPDSQGPGPITGSATSATATGPRTTAQASESESTTHITGNRTPTTSASDSEETDNGDDDSSAPSLGISLFTVVACGLLSVLAAV